ncbi:MAG TPA: DnaD domain protein [Thermomicrobiaceae bacterium]|nr:DnaD domain protein [Thermomicrobiaceae bacterium]
MDQLRPARDEGSSIPVPRGFFDDILPAIREIAEAKVLLAVYRLLAEPEWSDGMLPEAALYGDERLSAGVRPVGGSRPAEEHVRKGIELAVARGALLRVRVVAGEDAEPWLLPGSAVNRLRLHLIETGRASLPPSVAPASGPARIEPERPNVFRLYEQNVGLVTPIIADQLIEALELYPESWIEDAIHEAVSYNRRQWRYIQRVLERWATEGRGNEADRRHGRPATPFDPDRHLRGKYAPVFRRRS